MSPKRDSFQNQAQDRSHRTAELINRLLGTLDHLRSLYGKGRFGELDIALGRKPGFLSQVFKGRERLSLKRLFSTLSFLGIGPNRFFRKAFPSEPIPQAPVGFLVLCKEKVRTQPRISFGPELLSWGNVLEIDAKGAEFNPDIPALLAIINIDGAAAFKMASGALEGLLAIRPTQLTPTAAERLCRVLSPLADILRRRGDRNTACDLLDLAFRIDDQLDQYELRSLLLRNASYLLSDLALSEDAESLARDAVTLATLAGDLQGVSRSLYVQSEMLRRLDDRAAAMAHVQACLQFLTPEDASTRMAAQFALAYDRLESGDLLPALGDFERIEQGLETKEGPNYARILMALAQVRSKLGDQDEADDLFAKAQKEFASTGNAEDVALCGLTCMGHLLRGGRLRKSNELARELMSLAVQLKGNKIGQATLLHILRLSAQGRLTNSALEQSLQGWKHPWKRRRQLQP